MRGCLPAQGRNQAELRLVLIAEVRDRRDLDGVDPLMRQDDSIDATSAVTVLDRLMWRSLNSVSLRLIEWARLPPPTIRTRSGGVVALQMARAATRSAKSAATAARITRARSFVSSAPAGVSWPRRLTATVPTTPQAQIAGASSTVRCRIERWSASYRPASFATSTQIGRKATNQIARSGGRTTARPKPTAQQSARASRRRRRTSRHHRGSPGSPPAPPTRARRTSSTSRSLLPRLSGRTPVGGEVTCRLLLAHPALWESWTKGNGLSCSARRIALTSATLSPRCDSRLASISARRQSSESRCSA